MAHWLFAFQSFTKFPMKSPRSLHFQYDFTIKIIYNNIKRYTKRGKKLIACALYLIATLFCEQCWRYCHYIWDFREMKKNTYLWLQVKSVSLKMSGYAIQQHRQLLWIKLYTERNLARQGSSQRSKQNSLAKQLLFLLEMVEEKAWWVFPISAVHIQELSAVY